MIFNPDPAALVPALQGHVYEGTMRGPILKHPLVVQVPFYSADFANAMYSQKIKLVNKLIAKREYAHAIQIYERFCRLGTVYDWFRDGRLKAPMLRKLLKFAWPDTEDPPYEQALEMFLTAGYTSDNRKKLKGKLTLYRGDTAKRHNMEWSLSRKTAEWFARRWNPKTSWLATTEIDVSSGAVLAYFTGRGEEEVIVWPQLIKHVTYEKLAPRDTIRS